MRKQYVAFPYDFSIFCGTLDQLFMLRRIFVELTSIALVGSVVPFVGCSSSPTRLERILSLPAALATINDPETIAALGRSYLTAVPNENSSEKLMDKLLLDVEENIIAKNTDEAVLMELLNQKVLSDFEKGETVILDGWVLSKTEARQCALFSLTQTNN